MNYKVLVITGSFPPDVGGIQNYVYNLCKYSNHQITVLAPDMNEAAQFDSKQNFKIIREKFLSGNFLTSGKNLLKAVFRLTKNNKYDLIICNHVLVATIGRILSFFMNKPFLIITYGKDTLEFLHNPILRGLVKTNLKKSRAIITCSEYTKSVVSNLNVNQDKIYAVLPGVDSKFEPKEKNVQLLRKYRLENSSILYTIGRLVERKGHDIVIKSLPIIIEQIPNVKYLIVGDGEHRRRLEQLVVEYGVEDYVVFAGEVEDSALVDHYNIGDVFVMPSRYLESTGSVEGFGIVYLEAGACEKVVIGGNSGGAPEAVGDSQTGILVDPTDTIDIANKIINILINHNLAKEIAHNAHRRAKDEFSHNIVAKRFDAIIERYVSKK